MLILWRTVFKKLTVAQLVKKIHSLSYTEEHIVVFKTARTGIYTELDESNPHFSALFPENSIAFVYLSLFDDAFSASNERVISE